MYRHLTFLATSGLISFAAMQGAFAAGQFSYTFPPGDLQGWTQITVPGGTGIDDRFFATNLNIGGRITWQDPVDLGVGGVLVTDDSNTDARAVIHNTAVLRSPSFSLNGLSTTADIKTYVPNQISFKLLAGKGAPTGPANFAALPAVAIDNGSGANLSYLGVGLRRVSDGSYLLWGHRSSDAQSASWETITWDTPTLTAAVAGDAPGTLYTLDLIDAGYGNWGWVAMDSATLNYDVSTVSNVAVKPQDIIGAESGADHQLSVRFTRDGDLTKALDLAYTVEGTAFESTDYQALPNNLGTNYKITIPAGQASVDLPINIIPNSTTEIDRSVTVRLMAAGNYALSTSAVATVWISDVPQLGLTTVSGPLQIGSYLAFSNPLGTAPNGSLLFYGEGNYSSGTGYMTLGIRTSASDNSANGGVDVGRNNALGGNAIFDYLDNKGAASATARVAATNEITIASGHFTLIGEIQFQTADTGTIRSWIWDGQSGSLDYNNPNVTTTFSSGFINMGDQLYLRLDGNAATTSWTNARAIWAPGTSGAAAFAQLTPARPFLYVDGPTVAAGEFGDVQDLPFSVFRSGPPAGELTVPLVVTGSATAADFSSYPTSVTISAGTSQALANYHVIPDDLNEGTEEVDVAVANSGAWLLPNPGQSAAGVVLDRPFQDWLAAFLPAGSHDGAQSDTDGDGWVNLLEYYSGTGLNDSTIRSYATLVPGTKDTLRYQRDSTVIDVTGKVTWSTDLAHWYSSGESDGVRTVTITEQVTPGTGGQPDTVDAKASISSGADAPRLFLRLGVDLL